MRPRSSARSAVAVTAREGPVVIPKPKFGVSQCDDRFAPHYVAQVTLVSSRKPTFGRHVRSTTCANNRRKAPVIEWAGTRRGPRNV